MFNTMFKVAAPLVSQNRVPHILSILFNNYGAWGRITNFAPELRRNVSSNTGKSELFKDRPAVHPIAQKFLGLLNDSNVNCFADVKNAASKLFSSDFINHAPILGVTKDLNGFTFAILGFKSDLHKNKQQIKTVEEMVAEDGSDLLIANRSKVYNSFGTELPEAEKVWVLRADNQNVIKERYVFPMKTTLMEALSCAKDFDQEASIGQNIASYNLWLN